MKNPNCRETLEFITDVVFPLGMLVALGLAIGLYFGAAQVSEIRTEAVKAGVARWVTDKEGHVSFEWNRKDEVSE